MNTQALPAYPFGAPDASSEAASPAPFVILGGAPDEREAVSNAIGPDVRVVVGRMGAGKTRCLVELKRRLEDEGNCDLTPIDFDLPSLSDVTQLAEALALEPTQRAEIWRKIWKRAIVRAALSQVLARAGSERHEPLPDCLTSLPPDLVPSPGIPHSIYRDFAGILRDHQAIVDLRRFLDDREWEHVDYCFEQAFRQRTVPLCFFLDTGEDESSHAPRYWLWCQLGLVRQVLQFTHDGRLADKLRIFVAIRDQTWAELSNAKPAMYEQHPKVRQLRWGPRSAARFLGRKIQELPDEYRLKAPTTDAPQSLVTAWLGTDVMANGRRTGPEPLTHYLLRHTRLIPRDIVSVGNLLSVEVLAARGRDETEVPPHCIRNAVAESARLSAREELQACAIDVIGHQLAGVSSAAERRRIVPDEDASNRTSEAIKDLLAQFDGDVLPREALDEVDAAATDRFGPRVSLTDMLWRRGLIGWSADERGPFTFASAALPTPARRRVGYVAIHPCLVEELGLDMAVDLPVMPFAESELP